MGAAAGPPVPMSSLPSGVPSAGRAETGGAAVLLAEIAVARFTDVATLGDSSRLSRDGTTTASTGVVEATGGCSPGAGTATHQQKC